MTRALTCLLVSIAAFTCNLVGQRPVYVTLWFDTEDYIEPASDDAALRIAEDLRKLGVKATFKVVGEKARTLEKRGRRDVIEALAKHEIGYHTQFHSIPPAPAVYLEQMDFLEGAEEFRRREYPGFQDVQRIFGQKPSCYGQPGSSWGPQTNRALRGMGIQVYLDEGSHVGLDNQPFWFGGLLYIFNMGPYSLRASLDPKDPIEDALREFDRATVKLAASGGGVISIYYHPCEFVTTEFWDGVNFSHGANPPRSEWKKPQKRTTDDAERCFQVLTNYVRHMKQNKDVHFVSATDLYRLYGSPDPGPVDRRRLAERFAEAQSYLEIDGRHLSAADTVLTLLGIPWQAVEGPLSEKASTYPGTEIKPDDWAKAKADATEYIRTIHRLPSVVWVGSHYLSFADFAATLAGAELSSGPVKVRRANLGFLKNFASDPRRPYGWVIHPETFKGENLLRMARLQGWTLKPANLKK